jgi:hypothetical protein
MLALAPSVGLVNVPLHVWQVRCPVCGGVRMEWLGVSLPDPNAPWDLSKLQVAGFGQLVVPTD